MSLGEYKNKIIHADSMDILKQLPQKQGFLNVLLREPFRSFLRRG